MFIAPARVVRAHELRRVQGTVDGPALSRGAAPGWTSGLTGNARAKAIGWAAVAEDPGRDEFSLFLNL